MNPVNIVRSSLIKGAEIIEISAPPISNDVIGLQDLYLQLDITNTTVDMVSDEISSGSYPSGSNYVITPSYSTRGLVRK